MRVQKHWNTKKWWNIYTSQPAITRLPRHISYYISKPLSNHTSLQSLIRLLIQSHQSLTQTLIRSHRTSFKSHVSNQISNLIASPIALLSSHTSKIESPIASTFAYPSNRTYQIKSPNPLQSHICSIILLITLHVYSIAYISNRTSHIKTSIAYQFAYLSNHKYLFDCTSI